MEDFITPEEHYEKHLYKKVADLASEMSALILECPSSELKLFDDVLTDISMAHDWLNSANNNLTKALQEKYGLEGKTAKHII